MTSDVDVFELANEVTARVFQNLDINNDKTDHNLIIIKEADLKEGKDSGTIILIKGLTSYRFSFNLTSTYGLQGRIVFSEKVLNPQYEVSLYYVNSEYKFQFLETLNLSDVKPNSTYSFPQYSEMFYEKLPQEETFVYVPKQDNFVNGHLCLYCKVREKNIKTQLPRDKMLSEIFSFYHEKQLTDFKIICQGTEFLVHKLLLAAVSPVLRAMLKNALKESQEDEITIADFDPKTVERMVNFIYTDEIQVDLSEEELDSLFMIADKYSVERLKMLCIQERANTLRILSETSKTS